MAKPNAQITLDEQAAVAWLTDHDESCPVCGYQLRGTVRPVCSECGSTIRLGVVADARLGPYLFMVVAFACALGFDAVSAVIMAYGVLVSVSSPPEIYTMLGVMLLLALGSAIGLWITIRSRLRIVRMREGRWWKIAAIALVIFIVHAVAGLFIISMFI